MEDSIQRLVLLGRRMEEQCPTAAKELKSITQGMIEPKCTLDHRRKAQYAEIEDGRCPICLRNAVRRLVAEFPAAQVKLLRDAIDFGMQFAANATKGVTGDDAWRAWGNQPSGYEGPDPIDELFHELERVVLRVRLPKGDGSATKGVGIGPA